ncbi:MAG: insulinase family protein, partial [Bacteroidia bacterium]|nr:insulinase family protein [Bacteroidia bacterium]
MLNRTEAPAFKTIDKIDVLRTKHFKLDNGMDVYTLSEGSQELTKLEFIFRAGMYYQPAALIASSTNGLLESGTKSYTADELSGGIDFYGSFLELEADQDFAGLSLYSLNKYLEPSLKYLEEIVKYPTFPEDEFKIHIANKKQKHAINSQKVNVLARRRFVELLFGSNHPYGIDVKESDFDRVNTNEIRAFFKSRYSPKNCTIIASGKLPLNIIDILNNFFGATDWQGQGQNDSPNTVSIQSSTQQKHYIHKPDAIQSAIRVGRILFNK